MTVRLPVPAANGSESPVSFNRVTRGNGGKSPTEICFVFSNFLLNLCVFDMAKISWTIPEKPALVRVRVIHMLNCVT